MTPRVSGEDPFNYRSWPGMRVAVGNGATTKPTRPEAGTRVRTSWLSWVWARVGIRGAQDGPRSPT